jgi:UDP-N-acetylglucosamine transferase subunit ALG13
VIFVTVGTIFPFDRLIKAVDKACANGLIKEDVFAQIGESSYKPANLEYSFALKKDKFDEIFKNSSGVISHAGMGTILSAVDNGKPLLVMPRLKRFGEHVNDHQLGTARKFEQLGHVLAAYSEEELPDKLRELKTFVPKPRTNQAKAVADRIAKFLSEIRISKEQL